MRNNRLDLNEKLRKLSCGVLIIGGGGAGLRAAIEAHDHHLAILSIQNSTFHFRHLFYMSECEYHTNKAVVASKQPIFRLW